MQQGGNFFWVQFPELPRAVLGGPVLGVRGKDLRNRAYSWWFCSKRRETNHVCFLSFLSKKRKTGALFCLTCCFFVSLALIGQPLGVWVSEQNVCFFCSGWFYQINMGVVMYGVCA